MIIDVIDVTIGKSLIASALFDAFKERLKPENKGRSKIVVIELADVRHKDKLQSILTFLHKRGFIEYDVTFRIVIIRITEKGIARIEHFDSW